jgi:RNA polymerase sigma-70 factor (ECF subfamily)
MPVQDRILESEPLSTEGVPGERPVEDPSAHLAAVYRDYPGLRALILRRVRDPEAAADILQDAAVTTLEKLRNGEIAQVENVGGYLYRVALNHLRNYRRKDRTGVSSSEGLESLAQPDAETQWNSAGQVEWSVAARRILDEMPTSRDRDLLVRFYLNDEEKVSICGELGLTEDHFNRVIFRARTRFRVLLERRGFTRSDFLALAAIGLGFMATGWALLRPGAAEAGQSVFAVPTMTHGITGGLQ